MEKHVYFVRHGESNGNAEEIHRGDSATLTNIGHEQAATVAERIERIGVDALISSPLTRTRETAEHISKRIKLPIEESALFVERRTPSFFIGRSFREPEVLAAKREIFDGYLVAGHRHSDEENLNDLRARAHAALAFLVAHPAERICVVTHGMFLRVLFCAAFNPDFTGQDFRNAIDGIGTKNSGVSYLRYQVPWEELNETKRWRIVSWNDSAHLG